MARVLILDDMREDGLQQARSLQNLAENLDGWISGKFDLIIGSGTGALLAVMVGLLNIKARKIVKRYKEVWEGLHSKYGWFSSLLASTDYDPSAAARAIDKLIGRRTCDQRPPFFRDFRYSRPAVVLLGLTFGDDCRRNLPVCFSNQNALSDFSSGVTLAEALLGLMSRSGELPAVKIEGVSVAVGPEMDYLSIRTIFRRLQKVPRLVVTPCQGLPRAVVDYLIDLNPSVAILRAGVGESLARLLAKAQEHRPVFALPAEEKEEIVDPEALSPEQKSRLCIRCYERYIKTIFPCGHGVYCVACARAYGDTAGCKSCPICRVPCDRITRVYIG